MFREGSVHAHAVGAFVLLFCDFPSYLRFTLTGPFFLEIAI